MDNYTLEKILNQETAKLKDLFINFRKHNDSLYSYMQKYLRYYPSSLKLLSPQKQSRLYNCNTWALFKQYVSSGDIKQLKSNACGNALLCPYCASRRAQKNRDKILDIFNSYTLKDELNWYYIVLTMKNDFDIDKVFEDLKRSVNKIRDTIKDYRRGKNGSTFWKIRAGFYSYEITFSEDTGYHPHINFFVGFDVPIFDVKEYRKKNGKKYYNSKRLSDEWNYLTGGSYITSCSPISSDTIEKDVFEIAKYSLKFSSLPFHNLLEIYPVLYHKRLFGTLGDFYGFKIDIEKIDNEDFEDYYIFTFKYLDELKKYVVKYNTEYIDVEDEKGNIEEVEIKKIYIKNIEYNKSFNLEIDLNRHYFSSQKILNEACFEFDTRLYLKNLNL